MTSLILASCSRYRAELLSRLRLPFEQDGAEVDETPQIQETAQKLAPRLARTKAETVSARHPDRWVLGSDQAASCMGRLLGKPLSRDAACAQLAWMSGRRAAFVTALALVRADMPRPLTDMDVTVVRLRRLSAAEIERYVDAEPALDCAGSFKMEGLGITLFDEIQSRDPTGLIGLPLIATARLLRKAGFELP
ncbi:Maf family protein [Panacagrimonas sp.]|uniref:Maf family protein n=1 Tax=Panacagrimonas sp. TaxID=2480088 RepID=UPI003B51A53A